MKILFETAAYGKNLVEVSVAVKEALDTFFGEQREDLQGEMRISVDKDYRSMDRWNPHDRVYRADVKVVIE